MTVQRLLSDVLVLLADRSSGSAFPEDLRDAVESLRPAYGGLVSDTPAGTTITVPGTFYKADGTTAAAEALYDMSMPTDNKLQYDGREPRMFLVTLKCHVTCGTNAQVLKVRLAKNGTDIAETEASVILATAADEMLVNTQHLLSLSDGDYVEVFVTNATAGNAVTASAIELNAIGLAS